jgi:hypothetical protein
MIELIARLRNISVVLTAQEIARHFAADPAHDGEEVDDEIINSPVGALQPKHEAVQALGIRPETAKAFGAGYSAELQGRFVIPIFDARGAYVSYTGIKRDESDFYPEKFDATHVLFNAHRVFPAECLYVTNHPLKVLRGLQDGIMNAVSIFGVYDADRLLALSSFVRRRRLGRVEFF